ncbi:hypothetical protein CVIRNUC_008842 [Coccomyxa viridis]|uniref:Uncharacterized protein n=1 Tax=Coccomyxa viridis TaxID=1274662 RepID=A0AAV1IFZ8_9CHLO|nr:hypothetical protein CVIRNUC_008842 [Coccomyxa viridis]
MAYTCLQSPCSTSYAPALSSIHNFGSGCLTSGRKDVLGRWRRLQKVSTGRSASCRHSVNTIAGIKLIENYDGKFELARDSEDALKRLLDSPTFAKQVCHETGQVEGTEVTFTGMLFQPVPWSMQTKKGMPADFEKYAADAEYVIINTPPNFMFQAKIFKPSRLCAIFRKK